MGGYVPNTKEQRQDMLKAIGLSSMEDLFVDIPQEVRLKGELEIPQGKSELEVKREMEDLAGKNRVFRTIFRGAGAYRHYIPAAVTSIISKENFLTAYTPYQAEVSQGILQSIFEYQTMICDLTGMDASNASVYDGASAAAEGVAMCREKAGESADFGSDVSVCDSDHSDLLPWKRNGDGSDSGKGRKDRLGETKGTPGFRDSLRLHPAPEFLRKSGRRKRDRRADA
jgi:glycine cleavage system pyridoxal-binding protein P